MTHLTPEQLIDVAEQRDAPSGRVSAHLGRCAACRSGVDDLRAAMSAAADDRDIPEPSPLFWDHLSARVRDAVSEEAEAPRPWWSAGRFGWTLGAAAAAVAILIAASLGWRSDQPAPDVQMAATSSPSVTPAESTDVLMDLPLDDSWEVIADLTPAMDWDAADEAGIARPGASDHALVELSDSERAELKRLLALELARRGPRS